MAFYMASEYGGLVLLVSLTSWAIAELVDEEKDFCLLLIIRTPYFKN